MIIVIHHYFLNSSKKVEKKRHSQFLTSKAKDFYFTVTYDEEKLITFEKLKPGNVFFFFSFFLQEKLTKIVAK